MARLLTPRLVRGSRTSSLRGQLRPVVVTRAGPPRANSDTVVPGSTSRARWPWTTTACALPSQASMSTPAQTGEASTFRLPIRWSRRPPPTPITITRSARRAASSRASSRSVWSLSGGWRSIRVPACSAVVRASGDTESMSPKATATVRPAATAWSRPWSAATTTGLAGRRAISSGVGGSPPATTTTVTPGSVGGVIRMGG